MKDYLLLVFLGGCALMPLAVADSTSVPPASATATPSAPADAIAPLATAVLNFQTSDETMSKEGGELATMIEADLSASPHSLTVEREEVDKVLGEQELGMSGLVSADTAAKIGSLTGAQVLVTGRLFAVGSQYMAVAKIISTETSRVYGVTANLADLSSLPQAAQELSGKIDGVLVSHRDVLVVQTESPQQRLQRLRTIVGPPPLPSVMITLTERDYTQPTIDPAAQTEMTRQLQALGFPIVEADRGHRRADIVISGEAFSELGARHGSLISSRGRIEVKVTRGATGALLLVDRETQVAVDLGNRTAGKDALEKAAGNLVERMLPKLVK